MGRPLVLVAAIVLSGVVVAGCGSDDDDGEAATDTTAAAGTPVALEAANFAFDPTAIELAAGEAVTFVVDNADSVRHNLTIDGTDVDEDLEPGRTTDVPATLDAGTYAFRCEYHPAQMQGTITVT
ncbi:MAG: cupredoxin domain-containing protein [Actinomycetota bacterium]